MSIISILYYRLTCPKHLNLKCSDGFCVSDLNLCDLTNGCPYNLPYKCADGSCRINSTLCKNTTYMLNNVLYCNLFSELPKGLIACPDGSCAENINSCPLANGCPKEQPIRCTTGFCINPKLDNCTIGVCPLDIPVKCMNGLCVKSNSDC